MFQKEILIKLVPAATARDWLQVIVAFIENVCRYGGILIGLFSLWMFVTAINDGRPLKKNTARKLLIVALIMLAVSTCLTEITDMLLKAFTLLIKQATA